MAFPSNDFRQEPSNNEEIKDFCEVNEISFPIFAKGKVKGFEKQEVIKYILNHIYTLSDTPTQPTFILEN